jgi:glucose-1-phosphate cytidylyltransferase
MKVMLLAGGFGTRLSEETDARPKPLVEIGGWPILWHIMKLYSASGLSEFVICCGYKAEMIKQFFMDYPLRSSDLQIDLKRGHVERIKSGTAENWHITLLDTGLETMTGGRIKRAISHVDGTFCLTYGDGVADLDIAEVISFHKHHGKLATVTAVPSPGRFGILDLKDDHVTRFHEKPDFEMGWINGGFFVLEPGIVDYIEGDATIWERLPLERLAKDGQLAAFRHTGFWKPMDTLRDKRELEELWLRGQAPWKR